MKEMMLKEIKNTKAEAFGGAIGVLVVVFIVAMCLPACAGGRIYIGMERVDTVDETRKTTESNFLCGVMGYCNQKQ